ncbi:diguanylate cyclase [Geomonas sp.]|uniref:diguanylate cyclase n=1 Tax=Geomonas sp. TaxID=2651584 RepID=UPI002B4A99B8|nr:diguanylate cyclase [Geomonas sp.]HJV34741.1 diguanylate cyclase [Geomonas sp.]
MEPSVKEECRRLLARVRPAPKSRFSALLLKVGTGYAAMAVFTTAALLYSFYNLYSINRTARQIVNTDLPVETALVRIRNSLLAQEGFAGKYAIFRDPTFVDLFRKREKEALAALQVLEKAGLASDLATLKVPYLEYQRGAERLFAGDYESREQLHGLALRVMSAVDGLYQERQGRLQALLKRADEQQESAIEWAVGMSLAGFLLAVLVAPYCIYRVIRALGKLQRETHLVASGYFTHDLELPAEAEISELTSDFKEMADRMREMEQANREARPTTRLPGNLGIERILNERLASGTPFAVCHVQLDNFQPFLAQYGYAKAGALLDKTGVLIHCAVREKGAATDFAGHAGGECFVMVVDSDRVAAVCDAVVSGFDQEITRHLAAEDREAGGFRRSDRCGGERLFPITTVFISVVDCSSDAYGSAVDIARAAADAREGLDRAPGSGWDRSI